MSVQLEPVRAVDPTHAARVRSIVSRELLHHYGVAPVSSDDVRSHFVATDVEAGIEIAHEIASRLGTIAHVTRGSSDIVSATIEALFAGQSNGGPADASPPQDLASLAKEPPVIRYCSYLLREALARRASDLHLDAGETTLRVRLRVDGQLTELLAPPPAAPAAIISRFKLLAQLDISQRRQAQDGRFRFVHATEHVDLRVAVMPSATGETMVLRLLGSAARPRAVEDLGMPADILASFCSSVRRASGLVLVCGPTGSGKTTTLYAGLMLHSDRPAKVVTVEDPVELQLPFATQIAVDAHAGVTFSSALRSALRHDPDVILIGEIRDRETAEIAVRAAMTGHLVLATVHTTDALGAVFRLRDLGTPGFLLADTLSVVVAQRLVRLICPSCAGAGVQRNDQHCDTCNGERFVGRRGLFELLSMTAPLREALERDATRSELAAIVAQSGLTPFARAAADAISRGY